MPKKRTHDELYDKASGLVLRTGEYARPEGGYQYKKWNPDTRSIMRASATTLKELREKEKEITQQAAMGQTAGVKNTLEEYYKKWKLNKHIKPNVMHNYCYMYERYVPMEMRLRDVKKIAHSDVLTFYNSLLDAQKLAPATLDAVHTVLQQVFRLAVNDNVIFRNPCDNAYREAVTGRPVAKKREALTLQQQARLREVLQWDEFSVWRPLILFMLNTGVRIAELAGLTWDDIDGEKEIIHIRRNLKYYTDDRVGHCVWGISDTKTNAGTRDIPLTENVSGILMLQKQDGYPCTAEIDGISGFIFGNRFGDPQHQGTVNKAIKRIVAKANSDPKAEVMLPMFSTHILRHTYCTNLVYADVPLTTAAALMGHTSIETTAEIYNSVQPEQKRAAMEALAELEDGLGKTGKRTGKRITP